MSVSKTQSYKNKENQICIGIYLFYFQYFRLKTELVLLLLLLLLLLCHICGESWTFRYPLDL